MSTSIFYLAAVLAAGDGWDEHRESKVVMTLETSKWSWRDAAAVDYKYTISMKEKTVRGQAYKNGVALHGRDMRSDDVSDVFKKAADQLLGDYAAPGGS